MSEEKDSIPTPGTGTPSWVTIAEIVSITVLLVALLIAVVYLLKLTFVYAVIPIVAVVVKSWIEVNKTVKKQ
ncbi:hypothetical protein COY62_00020 [bacterium (Candidatus Howlettbacteria) CG_4_10_14_0_8_um_filter_40_9]|nr:MAG: hypothetical protein COY62_00020 [bacterium (Candidatus Howlettbacteria) CG_4_10_14_0_8_um_filter_40_9]